MPDLVTLFLTSLVDFHIQTAMKSLLALIAVAPVFWQKNKTKQNKTKKTKKQQQQEQKQQQQQQQQNM